jgi:GYF domain 2
MSTQWYCKIMGEEWGPMSSRELMAVARRRRLTRDDLVRRGSQGIWVRAENVNGLFNSAPTAPTATSDNMAVSPLWPVPAKRSVQSNRLPQYWLMRGNIVVGPVSADRVRQLAAEGQLQPEHLITRDRCRWVSAARVKGLTFGVSPNVEEGKTASVRSLTLDAALPAIPEELTLLK